MSTGPDDTVTPDSTAPEETAPSAATPPEAEVTPEEETFTREYVQRLRDESAGYRTKAKRTDELAAALWEARVAATGKLVNPAELPMPEGADPLDAEAVASAVEELLAAKPYLAARTPRGDVGQGATGTGEDVNLANLLRQGAQ